MIFFFNIFKNCKTKLFTIYFIYILRIYLKIYIFKNKIKHFLKYQILYFI